MKRRIDTNLNILTPDDIFNNVDKLIIARDYLMRTIY